MKIITVSDIHSDVRMVKKMEAELISADLILISGDLTNVGDREAAKQVIGEFRNYNSNILAVPGNCDNRSVETYLEEEGINIHCKCKYYILPKIFTFN